MGTLTLILKALLSGGAARAVGLLATPAVLVFAWNVLGKTMGDGFYRFITLAGIALALSVAVGHFWQGGKLAKFRATRGIGLMLSGLAVLVTCVGLGMSMLETIAANRVRPRPPIPSRMQDAPKPPAKSAPWPLDQTING